MLLLCLDRAFLDRAYATSVDEQDGENNGAINNLSTHKWSDVVKSGIILGN